MAKACVLEARGLFKEYDGENVVSGVDFELRAGEIVVLRGASGAGKSTLLSLLGLLLTPSAGSVYVDGVPTDGMADAELSSVRAEHFGFIFQHTQLIGSLRVLDNVLVPAMLSGRSGLEERARSLLVEYGLGQRMEHFPHQISVGQKRRVAVARAQLLKPAVILADEPTNDLDADNAAKVSGFLQQAAAAGQGVVVATHDDALASIATRTLVLERGRLT